MLTLGVSSLFKFVGDMGIFNFPYSDTMSIYPTSAVYSYLIYEQPSIQKIPVHLPSLAHDACKCDTY